MCSTEKRTDHSSAPQAVRFLAGNQPLTTVATNGSAALRWLARQPPGIDEARSSVEYMFKDADRATRIIGGLRDLTKQNAPRAEVVDLNEVIAEVIALICSEAVKTGVTVSTRPPPQLPRVQGDRVQLQQVILNLIVNAIQAMSGVEDGARELQISIDAVLSEGRLLAPLRHADSIERCLPSRVTRKTFVHAEFFSV
jgi:C4-dicarboxylate-specific signal transduction histidine kinase